MIYALWIVETNTIKVLQCQLMKKWQKIWLYLVIFYASLHIVRDIFQDLGIKNFLSTILESPGPPKVSAVIYWTIFNTYAIAGIEICLSAICLKRKHFGFVGMTTVIIAFASIVLWSIYFFFL